MSDPPQLFPRTVWDAAPRRGSPRRRKDPTAVVVHHSAGTRPVDLADAATVVRAIQRFHQIDRKWTDIAYNFVLTPTGRLWEGRGTDFQNGANTPRNHNTLSVCLLGDMTTDGMTSLEKLGLRRLADHYGLPMIPHSDVSSTECPGDQVRDWLAAGMPPPPTTGGDRLRRLRAAFADLKAATDAVSVILDE